MIPSFLQGAEIIGDGTYSTVYRIRASLWNKIRPPGSKATSHPTLALKEVDTSETTKNEIDLHKKAELCTESVPKFYGSFMRGRKTYLAMEDLSDYHQLDTMNVPMYAKIVLIMKKLHACGIVHADLYPRNVLIRGKTVKIIDFGLSYIGENGPSVNGSGLELLVYSELERAVDDKNIGMLDQWLRTDHGKSRDAMYMAIKEGWIGGVKHIIDSGSFKGQHLSYDMIDRAQRYPEIEKILENHGFLG